MDGDAKRFFIKWEPMSSAVSLPAITALCEEDHISLCDNKQFDHTISSVDEQSAFIRLTAN